MGSRCRCPWRRSLVQGLFRRNQRTRRSGAALAAALICLLIVILLSVAITRLMIQRHRATLLEDRELQCFWLAESAIARAAAKLRHDPTYTGESWQVALDVRDKKLDGVAEIRIDEIAGNARQRRIHVEARWPSDSINRISRRAETITELPP